MNIPVDIANIPRRELEQRYRIIEVECLDLSERLEDAMSKIGGLEAQIRRPTAKPTRQTTRAKSARMVRS